MRMTNRLLCTLCATLLLAGCSYFDSAETVEAEYKAPAETIDLMDRSNAPLDELAHTRARDVEPVESLTETDADGSVETFNLGGRQFNTAQPEVAAPVLPSVPNVGSFDSDVGGGSHSFGSSVEVFPLDEDMGRYIAPRNRPLVPPGPTQALASQEVSGGNAVIYFDHGESKLDNEDVAVITAVSADFKAMPSRLLSVEGHASNRAAPGIKDPVTRKVINLKASMNRALSVVQGLVKKGVPADSIRTVAWGEALTEGDSENAARRVEIIAE